MHGIDLDADSVGAAGMLLVRHAPEDKWTVGTKSVFDFAGTGDRYQIVHSWGVLHHTGAIWEAVELARALVADERLLILALYRKMPFCGFWGLEKNVYSRSPRPLQAPAQTFYKRAPSR